MCVCIGGHGKASSRGRLLYPQHYCAGSQQPRKEEAVVPPCWRPRQLLLSIVQKWHQCYQQQRGVHDYEDPQGTSDESSRGFSLNRIFQTRVSCRKNSQIFLYYLQYKMSTTLFKGLEQRVHSALQPENLNRGRSESATGFGQCDFRNNAVLVTVSKCSVQCNFTIQFSQ